MIERLHRATLFALFQLSIVLGILAMPLALAARRAGLQLPVHRLVEELGNAYDDAQAN